MQDLKKHLLRLKKEVIGKQKESKEVGDQIKKIVLSKFKEEKVLSYIRTFSVKNQVLFIETTNKAMAQELFWKSEELKRQINQKREVIKGIKIT